MKPTSCVRRLTGNGLTRNCFGAAIQCAPVESQEAPNCPLRFVTFATRNDGLLATNVVMLVYITFARIL
ncbi:hypothetical protein BDZ85DRAFT_264330 [Elsinoe ampelina]|uniref:Uncharacterized protein n=1 Tax=Elsinoe ampelina TaxID=302913 RepID=A0A6A6G7J7_9PEZI|nr:hypothetical protein BDZ85DRAFT_264330 [Elsinoe ampelina]